MEQNNTDNNMQQNYEQVKFGQVNYGQVNYGQMDYSQPNHSQLNYSQPNYMQNNYVQTPVGQSNTYPIINYIVSIAGLMLMGYLSYMMITSTWGFIYKILIWILFDGIVSLQVLMLALSIGKRDKNPSLNYKPVIGFNIFMLVLYGIGFVAYHVYFIMLIVNFIKGVNTIWT